MTNKKSDQTLATWVNEIRVVGRLSAAPDVRTLPSGDELATFRVIVPRARPVGRTSVDALECAAWSPAARRAVTRWAPGDLVEVSGALRRRFFRVGAGASSRVEIEVVRARRVGRTPAREAGP